MEEVEVIDEDEDYICSGDDNCVVVMIIIGFFGFGKVCIEIRLIRRNIVE